MRKKPGEEFALKTDMVSICGCFGEKGDPDYKGY